MTIQYQDSARVQAVAFFAIQWVGASLAFALLCFRLVVRWRSFKKLAFDDALVVFALSCFITSNILWHYELPKVYVLYAAEKAEVVPTAGIIADVASFLKIMPAYNILFVCCIWSIKFSFLMFFWDLGQRSHRGTAWWWIVAVITLGTMAACIGDYNWKCGTGSDLHLIVYCSSAAAQKAQSTAFRVGTAFDLLTDCLVMSIPMIMVWNLRLPLRKKLVLLGVFSLTVITMITALIRLLVIPKGAIGADLTWSFTWSNVEMSISIIVACLGAFRQLYTSHKTSREQYPRKPGGFTAPLNLSALTPHTNSSNKSRSQKVTEASDSTKSLNEDDPESNWNAA